jgi:hypothetical protein
LMINESQLQEALGIIEHSLPVLDHC